MGQVRGYQMKETYWKRVSYNNQDTESYPWELRFIEGKGYAAFATRDFAQGEWICTEFPAVWISGHHPFSEDQVSEIEKRVGKLGNDDQDAFYNMANVFPVGKDTISGGKARHMY